MKNILLLSQPITVILTILYRYWLAVWFVALIALIPLSLSSKTKPPNTEILNLLTVDKLLHFAVYGSLALMPLVLEPVRRRAAFFVAAVVMQSLILEALQVVVPGRNGSVGDAIANISGILFALVIAFVYHQFKRPLRIGGKVL